MKGDSIGQTIYFLRHCETEWNRKKLYQGRSDPPLSTRGSMQASVLVETLPVLLGVGAIFSSPLLRARTTATAIGARARSSVLDEPLLVELNYGRWEGRDQGNIKSHWPDLFRQWKHRPDSVTFPDGESLSELQSRVRKFLTKTLAIEGPLLAVTHTGVMRIVLLEAMGLPLSDFRRIRPMHANLIEINRCNGCLRLVARMNEQRRVASAKLDGGETRALDSCAPPAGVFAGQSS
jgi:probable phosphoglycerate mutase